MSPITIRIRIFLLCFKPSRRGHFFCGAKKSNQKKALALQQIAPPPTPHAQRRTNPLRPPNFLPRQWIFSRLPAPQVTRKPCCSGHPTRRAFVTYSISRHSLETKTLIFSEPDGDGRRGCYRTRVTFPDCRTTPPITRFASTT